MIARSGERALGQGRLQREDLRLLVCPSCRGPLDSDSGPAAARAGEWSARCAACAARWPFNRGFLRLYKEAEVKGTDRLMRAVYNTLHSLHDPATRYLMPVLQVGGSEREMREAVIARVDLGSISPRSDGAPARILEIGVGSGANLPFIERALAPSAPAEVWGVDLSEGMLRECVQALEKRAATGSSGADVRLLMADAHALPFPDHTFDRVFHVGALGSFRDPRRALAEMARVARPGTPIVVCDEQLDRARPANLYHRATFRLLTFYDADPHCPVELLPEGAAGVIEDQISRFYYCLTFKMPPNPASL